MTTLETDGRDFKVADLSLAPWGRKEIELAEVEMPGLMALRADLICKRRSARGARHDHAAEHPEAQEDDEDRAVELARERLAACSHVQVVQAQLPRDFGRRFQIGGERRLLDQARSLLVQELALAKKVAPSAMEGEIQQIFSA